MDFKRALLILGLVVAGLKGSVCGAAEEADLRDQIGLRILYAGHPGSSREGDFVAFLRKHFSEVKTSDLARFNGKERESFDVVIIDYDGDGFKAPQPKLSLQYARATVTVGVVGALTCDRLRLKSGYS